MISKNIIQEEKKQVSALSTIVDVYGEVAAQRMRKIRESVLKNRVFLSEIEQIFRDCLGSYSRQMNALSRSSKIRKGAPVTFLAHNGQTAAVLISANTGFYGSVIPDTFERFIHDVHEGAGEVTIIGRLGKSLFVKQEPNKPYTYFELPDFGIDREVLSEAIKHLVQYEEIKIYYGKYFSVINQKPNVTEIRSGTLVDTSPEKDSGDRYIFEPDVETILMFFETQIFASLFDQALEESQLAKFASRIIAMDTAGVHIKEELTKLNVLYSKIKHQTQAKKQLNTIVSFKYVTR
jgi:ATP synthase F1 gamma subunit